MRVHNNTTNKTTETESLPRRDKIYVPRVMVNMMQATTTNSTSIHYGTDHMCKKHKVLFNLEHIEKCDQLSGCQDIRKYANKLKDQHILDWDKEERLQGIALFAYLTVQM